MLCYPGPDVIPGNFALEGEAEAEEAVFTWDAIDPKPETVRGFFRGYKVTFLLGFCCFQKQDDRKFLEI